MVVYHHQLNGHEFEQTLGDREGQGSLETLCAVCYSPWGCKELDTTQRLVSINNNYCEIFTSMFINKIGLFNTIFLYSKKINATHKENKLHILFKI